MKHIKQLNNVQRIELAIADKCANAVKIRQFSHDIDPSNLWVPSLPVSCVVTVAICGNVAEVGNVIYNGQVMNVKNWVAVMADMSAEGNALFCD